jgi:hypothetical protein
MISHKHKCIFVHIPKAAGTSIEYVFMEDLGLDMANRHALLLGENTNKTLGPRRVSHLLAKEYVQQHFISQKLFNSYFKFAFVRNPYDRLYSTYKFRKFIDYISFDTYIKLKLEKFINSESEGYFFKTQYEYLYDSGKCLVDYIGRFENINDDFNHVLKELNLPQLKLKHHNKSLPPSGINRRFKTFRRIVVDYKTWPFLKMNGSDKTLSPEAKEIVSKYYQKDFETFGYNI